MKLAWVLVLVLASCGDDPNVGGTCTATDGCDDGLTCDTTIADGYCTSACSTSGSRDECPDGAVCDAVNTGLTCVKLCSTNADCRADLECNGVSSSNLKACKPKR